MKDARQYLTETRKHFPSMEIDSAEESVLTVMIRQAQMDAVRECAVAAASFLISEDPDDVADRVALSIARAIIDLFEWPL